MNFPYFDKVQKLQNKLSAFIEIENEKTNKQQLRQANTRWCSQPIM